MAKEVVRLAEGGRIVIPAKFRQEMGVQPGDELVLLLNDGVMEVMTPARAWKKFSDFVRRLTPPGGSLADELIRERRQEAAREEAEIRKEHGENVRR